MPNIVHFITFPLIYSLWWLCFRYFIVVQNDHWNVITISFKFFYCKIKLRIEVWNTMQCIRLSIYISHSFIILKSCRGSSLEEFIITGGKALYFSTLFLKLSTPILNTLKMNVFLWTDLKQADKDHYSDWSQPTEIELKAKLVSEWDQSNFLSVVLILHVNCWQS